MVSLEGLNAGFLRDQEGSPSDEVSLDDLAFDALPRLLHRYCEPSESARMQ